MINMLVFRYTYSVWNRNILWLFFGKQERGGGEGDWFSDWLIFNKLLSLNRHIETRINYTNLQSWKWRVEVSSKEPISDKAAEKIRIFRTAYPSCVLFLPPSVPYPPLTIFREWLRMFYIQFELSCCFWSFLGYKTANI